jgi:hypothetical protein
MVSVRTWQHVLDEIIAIKTGPTQDRWKSDCAGNQASRPANTKRASFGGWHERTANATMLVPARLGVGLAFQVRHNSTLYLVSGAKRG